jgi:hypothetical protein
MDILHYDEFNIYTTKSDVQFYIENLLNQGIESTEEIYNNCINHFGNDLKNIIDELFSEED